MGCRSEKKIDAHGARLRAESPALAFAAVTRDREVIAGGDGFADEAAHVTANGDTIFEAASIAKLMIAVSVMQLVERGALDLDADASTYLGFTLRHPRSAVVITLRMLLTHRASIRDRHDDLDAHAEGHPLAAFTREYVERPDAFLDAEPGTTTAYSNVGASLAASAVERTEGASFADVTEKRIFAPLRMTSTSWSATPRASMFVATPYARRDGKFVRLEKASHAVYPAVDLFSSAHDLSRFARAMLRGGELDGARLLAAASVSKMFAPDAHDDTQGLSWQRRTFGTHRVVGHEGEDEGASTGLYLDVANGTGAIVLSNSDAFTSNSVARAEALSTLVNELLSIKPQ